MQFRVYSLNSCIFISAEFTSLIKLMLESCRLKSCDIGGHNQGGEERCVAIQYLPFMENSETYLRWERGEKGY